MKSNAADVCARLGLSFEEFRPVLIAAGVSLDRKDRADQPSQAAALCRFVDTPDVIYEAGKRIDMARACLPTTLASTRWPAPAPGWSMSAGPVG